MFCASINYQFKSSEQKNVHREVGEANRSSLKVLLEWTGNVHFCTICEIFFIIFLVGGP